MYVYQGFFSTFWKRLKGKKLKLKEFFAKTQAKNSRNRKVQPKKGGKTSIFLENSHFPRKTRIFFSKNSRIFAKLKENFSKNSRNRKVHLRTSFAAKTLKKNPALRILFATTIICIVASQQGVGRA